MKMKREEYNSIVEKYRSLRARHGMDLRLIMRKVLQTLDQNNGIDSELSKESIVYSIVGNEFKGEMRSLIPKFNWNYFLHNCLNTYPKHNNSLIALSEENRMSYAIVCQHILQYYHNYDKSLTKRLSTNTSDISDGRLAFDVMLCNLNDIIYGNHSNHMTNNTGIVFESEISLELKRQKISFMSESQLRTDSFDVTPDFKLNLPIILRIDKNNNSNLHFIQLNHYFDQKFGKLIEMSDEFEFVVINWIECKALFASVVCHLEYYRNQYSSYVNRFGNGLVLYKLGFVSDIPQELKQNIVISDKFPQIIDSIK